MISTLLKVAVFTLSVYSLTVFALGTPKLRDYAESGGLSKSSGISLRDGPVDAPEVAAAGQESRVSIQVGETNGFYYTVNGVTYSPYKISISGEYYNNEILGTGYTRIFLSAQPNNFYYWITPKPNGVLEVYIRNSYGAEFFYEIIAPYPVSSRDLIGSEHNITTIRILGPSRSYYYPRAGQVTLQEGKLVSSVKNERV